MDQFPSNRRQPPSRPRDEPKKVERVIEGEVVRRKTPISRRLSQNLIVGNGRSVWGWMLDEVLIPAAQHTFADAIGGGAQRMVFGDSSHGSRRGPSRGGPPGHTAYNRYTPQSGRPRFEEPRREMSRRGRANHTFDEIILKSRVEGEEVLDRLDDLINRYESASVAELYKILGIPVEYTDDKWGWLNIQGAGVIHVRNGYLLNLPKPEPID